MLKFSEAQLAQIDHLEKLQYVEDVRKDVVMQYPELADDSSLKARLEQAYSHAITLGFVKGVAITQFLYYEAFAQGFYRQPAINAWLTKPGQKVEQRFTDLIAQLKSKLKEY
ncbi:hypothetical protein HSX11_18635 [Oxalobacteraceae bacterium]|nr:hypothetical protein [Oxalobacteraceae bacterium]